ncbi:hypothetical protein AGDE_16869 [Angomonas deanei]|uniref:Galactose oxidase, central domain containing protein, putative n=1 Tax=Angomonas deanei TaxID=59799 RepID=A0A7G2CND7_9TRYP|nr:hypothetical protein AGDE_16869 [Angomonas deanei]CAD2220464.1 Galactose oxidase, central domain containing protein, putative [Angomonas deanei]|eukprot:EPY16011.1 hypothetical protein AGDE_16869 [Angomonas deanei]
MPPRKSKSKSPSRPPAAPVCYTLDLQGPPLVLDARLLDSDANHHAEEEEETYREETYGSLRPTCGRREGAVAVLAPNQHILCVMGGVPAGDVSAVRKAAKEGDQENAREVAAAAPAASGAAQEEKETERRPAKKSKTTTADSSSKERTGKSASTVGAKKPPTLSASGKTKTKKQSATDAKDTKPTSQDPPAQSTAQQQDNHGNKEEASLPPESWRSVVPLVECYDMAQKEWFVPLGLQRRLAQSLKWSCLSTPAVLSWESVPVFGEQNGIHNPATNRTRPGSLTDESGKSTGGDPSSTAPQRPTLQESLRDVGPAEVCVIGGWNGVKRLSHVVEYVLDVPDSNHNGATLPVVKSLPLPPVTNHSLTNVKGKLYLFGGETADGTSNQLYLLENTKLQKCYEVNQPNTAGPMRSQTSLLASVTPFHNVSNNHTFGDHSNLDSYPDLPTALNLPGWTCTSVGGHPPQPNALTAPTSLMNSRGPSPSSRPATATLPTVVPVSRKQSSTVQEEATLTQVIQVVPPPPPRAGHAAAVLGNRFLIFVGGKQLVMPSAAAAVPGKGGKKSTKGGKKGGEAEEEAGEYPKVKLLSDVVAFDTEGGWWVQVKVTGGEAPCARHGAALCTLPVEPPASSGNPNNTSTSRVNHLSGGLSTTAQSWLTGAALPRELLLHGGRDEHGKVCQDAWVLHCTTRGSALLDTDPESNVPVLPLRWVRVRAERPVTPISIPVVAEQPSAKKSASRQGKTKKSGSNSSTSSVTPAAALQPIEKVSLLPARAGHSLVPVAHREVWIVGGTDDNNNNENSKKDCPMVRISVPPLQFVVEEAVTAAAF